MLRLVAVGAQNERRFGKIVLVENDQVGLSRPWAEPGQAEEGHGIFVAASGASADLLGEEFSVTGAFNLDDNGLRYVEIWRGDAARASYYVKTDGRHFEPNYDPPTEDNWIASFTDAITGDDPDDPRVIKMDPATDTDNYAGFFFPGTTDKFAFAHTVTDPNDPGNSYTVCYNMDRV